MLNADVESKNLYYDLKASFGDKQFKQLLQKTNEKYTKTGKSFGVGRQNPSQTLRQNRIFSDLFLKNLLKQNNFID